jgi:hypothetical protein
VIRQVSTLVRFESTPRVAVPLRGPTVAGTILVVAVITGRCTAGLRVSDNLQIPRWRMASENGQLALWYRLGSHPGVTDIFVETANEASISGSAVAAEVAGVSPGDAVQALADLLVPPTPAQAGAAEATT